MFFNCFEYLDFNPSYLNIPVSYCKVSVEAGIFIRLTYKYGAAHFRDYSALAVSSSTLPFAACKRYYFDGFERNINTGNGVVSDLDYIFADGRLVALVRTSGGSKTCYGVLTDRLGSLMSLYTGGGIVQKFSYDAWGNRRDPLTGVALSSSELASANSITGYGYTGHEHIDEFGLINMNARIYDPKIGMFISVDPQAGSYPGTYPYTYCGGDPVNRVDPTGEDYWSTSDPNVIYNFWKHYNENKGVNGYGFDGWYQMSDKEFLAAYDKYGEQALTYNDRTSMLYSYEGKVENGEVVIYGKHIKINKTLYRPLGDDELQFTGEPPLPGFSALKLTSLLKSVKGLFKFAFGGKNAVPVVRAYTKSNLQMGRRIETATQISPVQSTAIRGVTRHGVHQMINRGFKVSDIWKIIREGVPIEAMGRYGSQIRYTLNGNTVILNAQGKIVSVFSNLPGTRNGIGRGSINLFE